jgi:light-regulated signal transduction histidine kinase (bacteriophytochrome)
MRILIAEDAPVSRRLLQQCLQQWGYEVVSASNGAEAWQLFSAGDALFHIVISDWMMPEMDGPDLIRRIRASSGSNYVYTILLTAKSEREDVVAGMEAGADDFLRKPFDRDELRVRLRAGERIVQLEQTLAVQNQELRQRIEEVETFIYTASHDLQTPLRTFGSYAQLLLADYGKVLDEEGRELCEAIVEDALHMKTLLDSLLEFASLSRDPLKAVDVDVQAELAWALHNRSREIAATEAIVQVPDTLPTVVYSEGRLTQIFSHLLSNALRFFCQARPPVVRVGCDETAQAYRFTVQDNGIGIAPQHVNCIFNLFKRLHTRDTYPGTGAGLTIVKKIVECHGGEIGVTSALGEGSTFWFTVPKVGELPCGE